MFDKSMNIAGYDDDVMAAITAEEHRQEEHIANRIRKLHQSACHAGSGICTY